jgi:hypothetical protein
MKVIACTIASRSTTAGPPSGSCISPRSWRNTDQKSIQQWKLSAAPKAMPVAPVTSAARRPASSICSALVIGARVPSEARSPARSQMSVL